MKRLKSVLIAFSMYSAIPMPRTEWEPEGMRYALCAFPLVGLAVAAALWCWGRCNMKLYCITLNAA